MSTYLILGFVGVAVGVMAARVSFFALPQHVTLPESVIRALRYAPLCALTAVVAPALLVRSDNSLAFALDNFRLWAAAAATVAFLKWRDMLVTMGVGFAAYTVLRLLAE